MRPRKFILFIVILLGLQNLIYSQEFGFGKDFERIAPQSVPKQLPQQKSSSLDNLPEVSGDTNVLIPELKGIVFLGAASDLIKDETQLIQILGGQKIALHNLQIPSEQEFNNIVSPYIGKETSMNSLGKLNQQIILHYRAQNRPVVDVFVPTQTLSQQILQIAIIEGKRGKLSVEGNEHFKSEIFENYFRTKEGEFLNSKTINDDILWINKNPFRQAEAVFEKGNTDGSTDVIIQVQDIEPIRTYVSIDDSGNDLTGDTRLQFGANLGSILEADQQLSYQFLTDKDTNLLEAHSISWITPLPWRHTLMLIGSYAESGADFPDPTQELDGTSWQLGLRYNIDLEKFQTEKLFPTDYTHSLTLGYDYKSSDNQLLANKIIASDTTTGVSQFSISYNINIPDKKGNTNLGSTLVVSPGGMTGHNNDTDFIASGASSAEYNYIKLDATRTQKLPQGLTLLTKFSSQWSDSNLLGSEQFGAGGYSSVRGYDEREANGDYGLNLSVELLFPSFSPSQLLQFKDLPNDSLQALLFIDYANVSTADPTAASINPNVDMLSVGYGFRYTIQPWISFRFDHGFQLIDSNTTTLTRRDYNHRAHFGLTVSY